MQIVLVEPHHNFRKTIGNLVFVKKGLSLILLQSSSIFIGGEAEKLPFAVFRILHELQ